MLTIGISYSSRVSVVHCRSPKRCAGQKTHRGHHTGFSKVDHIIPRAVAPLLDLVLANLEHMPNSLNMRKGAKVGQRQVDLANKLEAAGLLTPEDHAAIVERQMAGYRGE